MIERFTLDEFKQALPDDSIDVGIVGGEHVFEVPLTNAKLIIRSSIGPSGIADSTGENSIRILLMDLNGDFVISEKAKLLNYVTRTPGWKARMYEKIENMVGILDQLDLCATCGKLLRVNIVQNPKSKHVGKLFASCRKYSHDNGWKVINPSAKMAIGEYQEKHGKIESKVSSSLPPVLVPVDRSKVRPPDFNRLNDKQLAVVNNLGYGASKVTASAGSGKTTTMVDMIINMILNGIDPSRILAVTFTRKAAAEMRIRIAKALWADITDAELAFFADPNAGTQQEDDPFAEVQLNRDWVEADPIRMFLVDWVCTIHAMSLRLLKASGVKVNVLSNTSPHWFQVKQIINDSLDEFGWQESPKNIQWWIDLAVENMVDTRNSKVWFESRLARYSDVPYDAPQWLSDIYFRYLQYCKAHNLVSFTMMQTELLKRIRTDRSFLDNLMSKFDFVVVDEFQDTDFIQAEILFSIIEKKKNITAIGDTRQSIYRFKGAKPEIMEVEFQKHWKDTKTFGMPINYRSDQVIIDATNKLIRHNYTGEIKVEDALPRPGSERGQPIDYVSFDTFDELNLFVAEKLLESKEFGDWAILSRTRAECAAIHTELIKQGIPAINLNGGLLFGASHIRKVLAYMRLAINYQGARDDLDILREVANVASDHFVAPMTRRRHIEGCSNTKPWVDCGCPVVVRENVDMSTVRYYGAQSVAAAGSWRGIEAQQFETNKGHHPTLASKGAGDLVYFVNRISQFSQDALACMNVILSESVMPWLAHEEGYSDADDPGEESKAEDFDVLRQIIKTTMTVEQFLTDLDSLAQVSENSDEVVEVSTIHKYKGLEKPNVILNMTRLPIVPPKRKKGQLPTGIPNSIEDERNLAYVGATRAMHKLILVESAEWLNQECPWSPFVEELGFTFN